MAVPADAQHLTEKMRHAFVGLQHQLRADIGKVDEPHLKALFEESAEVLGASPRPSRTTSQAQAAQA